MGETVVCPAQCAASMLVQSHKHGLLLRFHASTHTLLSELHLPMLDKSNTEIQHSKVEWQMQAD